MMDTSAVDLKVDPSAEADLCERAARAAASALPVLLHHHHAHAAQLGGQLEKKGWGLSQTGHVMPWDGIMDLTAHTWTHILK